MTGSDLRHGIRENAGQGRTPADPGYAGRICHRHDLHGFPDAVLGAAFKNAARWTPADNDISTDTKDRRIETYLADLEIWGPN